MSACGTFRSIIKCTLSQIKFPEKCPVCLGEPFDLIAVTVFESIDRTQPLITTANIYSRGRETDMDRLRPDLRSSVVFWIPACEKHMDIRTIKKKILGVMGFFLFFYPMLFFILGIIRDLQYGGNLLVDLPSFLIFGIASFGLVLYGFYPRSLERSIIFERVNRGENKVHLRIANDTYRKQFLELNEAHAEIVSK